MDKRRLGCGAAWLLAFGCGVGEVQGPVGNGGDVRLGGPVGQVGQVENGGAGPTGPGGTPGPGNQGPVEEPEPEPEPEPVPVCEPGSLPSRVVGAEKVKTLLTGLPLTPDELSDLEGEGREALATLIDGWLALPEAEPKLLQFFGTAFQQDGLTDEMLDQLFNEGEVRFRRDLEDGVRANFEQSIPRTALAYMKDGTSLTELVEGDRFMMTTAMMVLYAHWDERHLDDEGRATYRGPVELPDVVYHRDRQIPIERSLDPSSPDFMNFSLPDMGGGCSNPYTVSRKQSLRALQAMFGRAQGNGCLNRDLPQAALTDADLRDWRLVRVRAPEDGEEPDSMFDYASLRGRSELVLRTPRRGFFTTPAFFGIWQTNDANSHRVSINQALIVALGKSFDSQDSFLPAFEDALDDEHAVPGTTCYGCHKNLDPMRQFYRQSYTVWYGEQLDASQDEVQAEFLFQGVQQAGRGIEDLARILAQHPKLAPAWVQKLCYAANSEACPEGDAEFTRVVDAFEASGHDLKVLVRELYASPLVTGHECIEGGTGHLTGIARRRHFCSRLENRLQMPNACSVNNVVRNLVDTIPDDGFSRSDVEPVVIREDNLFVRAAEEKICREVALRQVGEERFPHDDPELAVRNLVEVLMGYAPPHPRHDAMIEVLTDHVNDAREWAREQGSNDFQARREAVRSAFMLACQSPAVVGMGL